MRIGTHQGIIETRRSIRGGPNATTVVVEETFEMQREGRPTPERGIATMVFARELFERHPGAVDDAMGREIARMIERREVQVDPQVNRVGPPGVLAGGVLPPAELRPQYYHDFVEGRRDRLFGHPVVAQENVPGTFATTGGVIGEFRGGNWAATNNDRLRYTWTPDAEVRFAPLVDVAPATAALRGVGDAIANAAAGSVGFHRAMAAQQADGEVKQMATKIKQDCACGSPEDENWQHAHDECTFLDRPSSEWVDEGHA